MNNKTGTVALPAFGGREYNDTYAKHTMELSDQILETIETWIYKHKDLPEADRPSAMAIGAACYVALWKLAADANDDIRDAMLYSCAVTLLKNDTKFQLSVADLPHIPN